MGWDGAGWGGMGRDGAGWDGVGQSAPAAIRIVVELAHDGCVGVVINRVAPRIDCPGIGECVQPRHVSELPAISRDGKEREAVGQWARQRRDHEIPSVCLLIRLPNVDDVAHRDMSSLRGRLPRRARAEPALLVCIAAGEDDGIRCGGGRGLGWSDGMPVGWWVGWRHLPPPSSSPSASPPSSPPARAASLWARPRRRLWRGGGQDGMGMGWDGMGWRGG